MCARKEGKTGVDGGHERGENKTFILNISKNFKYTFLLLTVQIY